VPRGILYVETRPASPEQAAEYHAWYDEIHLQEMLALDGYVAARRFAPFGDEGPFVAIYEIEADDLAGMPSKLTAALRAGNVNNSPTVQTDPPPVVRFLREITATTP
jgi:hypothetical protein